MKNAIEELNKHELEIVGGGNNKEMQSNNNSTIKELGESLGAVIGFALVYFGYKIIDRK